MAGIFVVGILGDDDYTSLQLIYDGFDNGCLPGAGTSGNTNYKHDGVLG